MAELCLSSQETRLNQLKWQLRQDPQLSFKLNFSEDLYMVKSYIFVCVLECHTLHKGDQKIWLFLWLFLYISRLQKNSGWYNFQTTLPVAVSVRAGWNGSSIYSVVPSYWEMCSQEKRCYFQKCRAHTTHCEVKFWIVK